MMSPTPHAPLFRQHMRRDDQMLYLMIKPHPEQAAIMDALRRRHGLSRKHGADRLHITLQPFGDIRAISHEDLERIRHAAASLQVEPFEVSLNRISGNRMVGSRMQALRDFQRALAARLLAFDVELPDYAFDPHASLSYAPWKQRNILVPPVTWRVDRLLLVNSIGGKGHQSIDSWPLVPRQGCLDL